MTNILRYISKMSLLAVFGLFLMQQTSHITANANDNAIINDERVQQALYNNSNDLIAGNINGDVTNVEFFDYQCAPCKRAHRTMKQILKKDNNIKIIYKEYPILGDISMHASRIALSIETPEKYSLFHDKLLRIGGRLTVGNISHILNKLGLDKDTIKAKAKSQKITKHIDETKFVANLLGIRAVPTFIIDNHIIRGFIPADKIQALIKNARENKS